MHLHQVIGLVGRVSANGPGDLGSIRGRVIPKTFKMVLDTTLTQFLPGSGHIDTAIWLHYMDANKTAGEEARCHLHKNAACNPEQVLAAIPHKTPTVQPPAPYHENYSS